MEFDDVFEYIGEFGPYQFVLFMLLGITGIFPGMQNMGMTIIGMWFCFIKVQILF